MANTIPGTRRREAGPRRLLLLLLLVLMAAGCGGDLAVAPPVDLDRGRAVLRDALDAWKGGQPYDALAGGTPPIRVADEDWLAGLRLTSYRIDPKDQLVGAMLRCPVSLSLKDKAGKTVKKRACYNVTTSPAPAVIRQD
ncbi:MAG TPA: hypothetical protein VF590_01675 [Isosphaeraceae bacterium]|jgi:hypothetical protein